MSKQKINSFISPKSYQSSHESVIVNWIMMDDLITISFYYAAYSSQDSLQ